MTDKCPNCGQDRPVPVPSHRERILAALSETEWRAMDDVCGGEDGYDALCQLINCGRVETRNDHGQTLKIHLAPPCEVDVAALEQVARWAENNSIANFQVGSAGYVSGMEKAALIRSAIAALRKRGVDAGPSEPAPPCAHFWIFVPGPSGQIDGRWRCQKCPAWSTIPPSVAALRDEAPVTKEWARGLVANAMEACFVVPASKLAAIRNGECDPIQPPPP